MAGAARCQPCRVVRCGRASPQRWRCRSMQCAEAGSAPRRADQQRARCRCTDRQLDAAAKALGPDIDLALRLDGQLDPADLGPLREHGRKLKLGYIADPCADLAQACRAFAHGAPPLAVSAHRHEPQTLARAMRDGGVQVLLVDPAAETAAARMWSVAADMTGVELAVVGDDSGMPVDAARIASTLRAATQPVIVGPSEAYARCDFPTLRRRINDHPHHAASREGADAAALCQRAVYAPHHRAHRRRTGNRRRPTRLRRDQRH